LNKDKHDILVECVPRNKNIELINGDANEILVKRIFPRYEKYRRGFCVLDPYTHKELRWETIVAAAETKCIDLLIHFPTMTMNRGVLHKSGILNDNEAAFMTQFWGDDSWRPAVYQNNGLFADHAFKVDDATFVRMFCERLKNVAGFAGTAKPIPTKQARGGGTLYYLVFAGHHGTALKKMRETAAFYLKNPLATNRKSDFSALHNAV
jgi:three-Cys-motif partner protein